MKNKKIHLKGGGFIAAKTQEQRNKDSLVVRGKNDDKEDSVTLLIDELKRVENIYEALSKMLGNLEDLEENVVEIKNQRLKENLEAYSKELRNYINYAMDCLNDKEGG